MKSAPSFQSLLNEQQREWSSGNQLTVEELIRRSAEVSLNSDERLDLIYAEVLLCEKHGKPVNEQEYLKRFPDLIEQLRLQFEVHRGLADFAAESTARRYGTAANCKTPNLNASDTLPADLPEGYEFLGLLGRGGAGTVYHAVDRQLKRDVAIKLLWEDDADSQQRLSREAKTLAKIHHPNVVQVFCTGEHRGRTWMAQEYVAGGSLRGRLNGQPLNPRLTAQFLARATRGVAQAQSVGIVHCDISPGNILIDIHGCDESDANGDWLAVSVPKVSDFGLARWMHADRSESGRIEGTLLYMAPEQALGSRSNISQATDVYGLGAVLYEMLTGRPPFLGSTVAELLDQILQKDPVSPRTLRPQLDRDLETICLKCLDKNPEQRYASAADLLDDLDRYQENRPIVARPIGWVGKSARWANRNRALAASLAAVFISLVAGIATTSTAAWIANANSVRANRATLLAGRENARANTERDNAIVERDSAERNALEARRLASAVSVMLSKANPSSQSKPYLLADWILENLDAEEMFSGLSLEYAGKLRLELARTLEVLGGSEASEAALAASQQKTALQFRRAAEDLEKGGFTNEAADAKRRLAILLVSKKAGWTDYPERFEESEKLLLANIESKDVSDELRRSSKTCLAQSYYFSGRLEEAEKVILEQLGELKSLEPRNAIAEAEATRFYATILTRTDRIRKAIPLLREIVAHPPDGMNAVSFEETTWQLAECLFHSGPKFRQETFELCESFLPKLTERIQRPTDTRIIKVADVIVNLHLVMGEPPKRLLKSLEPLFGDLETDESSTHEFARIIAVVNVSRAEIGDAARSYKVAVAALRQIFKLLPKDHQAMYMQLSLAKHMCKQGLGEHALPLAQEIYEWVMEPDTPQIAHYLRIPSMQTLYGICMVQGDRDVAKKMREEIPAGQVPQLPEHLIHPSLREEK